MTQCHPAGPLYHTRLLPFLTLARGESAAVGAENGLDRPAEAVPLASSEAGYLALASRILTQSYLSQAVLARRNGNYVAVKVK